MTTHRVVEMDENCFMIFIRRWFLGRWKNEDGVLYPSKQEAEKTLRPIT